DEFPGSAYDEEFGEEYPGHAAWLARALHDDVDDRQDLYERDLWSDQWVRAWRRANATTEIDALANVAQRRAAMAQLWAALAAVAERQDAVDDEEAAPADALAQVQALGPGWEADAIADAHDALREAVSSADRQTRTRIENDVLPALAAARRALDDGDDEDDETGSPGLGATTVPDRLGGDLAEMVE